MVSLPTRQRDSESKLLFHCQVLIAWYTYKEERKRKARRGGQSLGTAQSTSVASWCTPAPPSGSGHDFAPTKDGCPAGSTGNYPNYIYFDLQQILFIVYFQTVQNLIITSTKHCDLCSLMVRLFHYESISIHPVKGPYTVFISSLLDQLSHSRPYHPKFVLSKF